MVCYGMMWHSIDTAWHGRAWYGLVWCGVVWPSVVWPSTVWYGMTHSGMAARRSAWEAFGGRSATAHQWSGSAARNTGGDLGQVRAG